MLAARPRAVLIAGPTASGKSHLAAAIAKQYDGVVVNADSMQVYREMRVVSARPSTEEERRVPHRLYGHVSAATRYSAGRWLTDVEAALADARGQRRLPVIVGGTGLYFKALTQGLAAVPPVPAEIHIRVAAAAEEIDSEVLHDRLTRLDPETAATLRPSDRGRIIRALEVFEATGRSLVAWRSDHRAGALASDEALRLVITPDRAWLHERISHRAEAMLGAGVLDEVRRLVALRLPPVLPAMKAIGVRQFGDHLHGRCSLDEAVAGVKTETRRYARRQETWFRNQMADWRSITPPAALGAQAG
ncbi:MAG: tRNA (adenosine(37)-N6)-dimethylallyltransferase MiaA [Hyphomicrobiales bacterium]|nr:tRNA (adenosine(37)-N6)-dimethylallyltransferase MiaA [Hyphomicrobiales bacterium]